MHVSVVIVGGGPAGTMAGLRLARAGIDVLIVDRVRETRPVAAEILSPEGRQILEREALWDTMPLGITMLCSEMAAAWEDPVPQWTSFLQHPYGPAWHIDRVPFDAWLTQAAVGTGARVVNGTVDVVREEDARWHLEFDVAGARQSAIAIALVLATGRSSPLRPWCRRVPRPRFGTRQRIDNFCLVSGTTLPDREHPDALIVEAVEDGWWYSAPLMNGELFAGWMTDFSLVPHGRLAHVSPRTGGRYVDAAAASLARAPIHRRRLGDARLSTVIGAASWATTPSAGPGWIAVGDAALARDPISGDGLASALRAGWAGAEVVQAALGGDAEAWTRAADEGAGIASRYQQQRLDLYRRAQPRWLASPFWRRFSA